MAYLDATTRLGPGGGPRSQYPGFVPAGAAAIFAVQLVVAAATAAVVPQSFTHAGVVPDDVVLESGGTAIGSAHHREQQAIQSVLRGVVIAAVAAEEPPPSQALIHGQPESPRPLDDSFVLLPESLPVAAADNLDITRYAIVAAEIPEQARSTVRSGVVPADVTVVQDPEILRQLVVEAARREIVPASWLRDGQVPTDVVVADPASGTQFASAHHRELRVVPPSLLGPAILPVPEKSVRFIQIVAEQPWTEYPNFVGIANMSFLYPGEIEYSPVLTHYRWYDDDNVDVDLTTAIAAEDTVLGIESFGASRHLRLAVENRGGDKRAVIYQLQAALNGGGWFDVDGASSNTRAIGGQPADADSTSFRLTRVLAAAGGEYDEVDGVVDITHFAQRHIEFVFSVQFIDADLDTGDELAFRLREESAGFPARAITQLVNARASVGEVAADPIVVAADDDVIIVAAETIGCGETDANTITVAAEDDTIFVKVDDDTVTVDA